LAINAQQQAQLERLYRQSINQQANAVAVTGNVVGAVDGATALSGVQQLQLEFQKLCASTKDNLPGTAAGTIGSIMQSPTGSSAVRYRTISSKSFD
jgi:hypothetical protein